MNTYENQHAPMREEQRLVPWKVELRERAKEVYESYEFGGNTKHTEKMQRTDTLTDLTVLESLIGHTFNDQNLLMSVVTHSSCRKLQHPEVNGRIELGASLAWIGQSVLKLAFATTLMETFRSEEEDFLTHRVSNLMRPKTLARFADEIGLSDFVMVEPQDLRSKLVGSSNTRSQAVCRLFGALHRELGMDKSVIHARDLSSQRVESTLPLANPRHLVEQVLSPSPIPNPVFHMMVAGEKRGRTIYKGLIQIPHNKHMNQAGYGLTKRDALASAAERFLQRIAYPDREILPPPIS